MSLVRRDGQGIITRYRPLRFSEVIGHKAVKASLERWFDLGDNRSRTLLFTGPPSSGKTTIARIIALGLNCEKGVTPEPCLECKSCKDIINESALHVFEGNMSSASGKDDADRIADSMLAPSLTGRFKVYILDEAHGMSNSAMNSILKPSEEPPKNTYVIYCTSNPEKLNKALSTRCELYELFPPSLDDIKLLLKNVVEQEGVELTNEQKNTILKYSQDLPYREILTALSQFVAGGSDVIAGKINAFEENYQKLIDSLLKGNIATFSNDLQKFWNNRSEIKFDAEQFRRTLRSRLGYLLLNEGKKGLTIQGVKYYEVLKIFDGGVYGQNNEAVLPSIMKDAFEACVIIKG